jgi:N-acetylglucosaminyldiphosphoundecaprenol N-acetyl-beta-D-mannosaminyltransferase
MTDWQVDPRAIRRANVLGVGIHAINMSTSVKVIEAAISRGQRGYVCATGVHGVMEAQRDPTLVLLFANALLVVPDGTPTVWMGHLQGLRKMERVFGPDLMFAVAGHSEFTDWSHFLCGGNKGVAEQLRDVLLRRFPSIHIVGTYTPPFRRLTTEEESDFIRTVDRLRPDIIWVGLSTPKQERFMAEYLPRLNTTLMIGVGAAFDFHTGGITDSPSWVKRSGLQWLHRLIQEPSRLWKRYLLNNPQFLLHAGLQLARLRRYELQIPAVDVSGKASMVNQVCVSAVDHISENHSR